MSIRYFDKSRFVAGVTQSPLSFDNESLGLVSIKQSDLISTPASLSVDRIAVLSQVHGNEILEFEYLDLIEKCCEPVNYLGQADAIIISKIDSSDLVKSNLAVGIRTADCLPIIIESSNKLALLHAGWRGLAAGIIEKSLRYFIPDPSFGERLRVFIGPAAKSCCYQVGVEVWEALNMQRQFEAKNNKIDLQEIAQMRIQDLFKESYIEIDSRCTICSPLLHSYRRNKSALRNLTYAIL